MSTIVLGTIYWPFFCKNPSQLQGTHTAETLAGGFLVIWSKAHIFWGGTSFRNGSLLFNLQYLGQIFIKSNNQGQFWNPQEELISKLSLLARFDKIWPKYWRLKRRLPFRNDDVFFAVGCRQSLVFVVHFINLLWFLL